MRSIIITISRKYNLEGKANILSVEGLGETLLRRAVVIPARRYVYKDTNE